MSNYLKWAMPLGLIVGALLGSSAMATTANLYVSNDDTVNTSTDDGQIILAPGTTISSLCGTSATFYQVTPIDVDTSSTNANQFPFSSFVDANLSAGTFINSFSANGSCTDSTTGYTYNIYTITY